MPNIPAQFPMTYAYDYANRMIDLIDKMEDNMLSEWDKRIKSLILQHGGYTGDSRESRFDELDNDIKEIYRRYKSDNKDDIVTIDELHKMDEALRDKAHEILGDSPAEQLAERLEQLRNKSMNIIVTSNTVRNMAESFVNQVKSFSIRQLNDQIEVISGVRPHLRNPRLQDIIQTTVRENVKYIKTIPEKYHNEVERVIHEGILKGESISTIRDNVDMAGQKTTNNARLIARDQTGNVMSSVTRFQQTEYGINKFEWASVGDSRVRPRHQDFDGNVYTWEEGANGAYPGSEIQCRCVALPEESQVIQRFGEAA